MAYDISLYAFSFIIFYWDDHDQNHPLWLLYKLNLPSDSFFNSPTFSFDAMLKS